MQDFELVGAYDFALRRHQHILGVRNLHQVSELS
jgi:hypothetical protein